MCHRAVDHRFDGVGIRRIELQGDGIFAERLGGFAGTVLKQIGDRHAGALADETPRHRAADAAAAAGDDGYFTV